MELSAEKGMMSDTPRKHNGDNEDKGDNEDNEDKGDNEDNEDKGDNEDDEDEDDQPQDQYLNNPQCTVSCWIKLLVKHLMAKHRLETHCRRLHTHGIKSTFEINILRVNKIEDDLPSWEEVTSIITSVIQKYFPFNNFPSSDMDLQMINWLLQYIDKTLQDVPSSTPSESSTSMSRNYNHLFRVFWDILDRIKCLPFYTRHCELCMAAFSCAKSEEVAWLEPQSPEPQDDTMLPNFWKGEMRRLQVNIHELQWVIFIPFFPNLFKLTSLINSSGAEL